LAGATAKELLQQSGLGAGGETAGQLVSEGKISGGKEIFLEGIAEIGTAPVEVAGNLREFRKTPPSPDSTPETIAKDLVMQATAAPETAAAAMRAVEAMIPPETGIPVSPEGTAPAPTGESVPAETSAESAPPPDAGIPASPEPLPSSPQPPPLADVRGVDVENPEVTDGVVPATDTLPEQAAAVEPVWGSALGVLSNRKRRVSRSRLPVSDDADRMRIGAFESADWAAP
jgi:hypothetical protein